MTSRSDLADVEWLTGSEAGAILADLVEDAAPAHTKVDRLRKTLSTARTHLVLEQVALRHRATAKFTQPQKMFFTRAGLEQSTDEWIAGYKAQRFAPHPHIADLCCGIGGDLLGLAKVAHTIGVDLDPISAHFAAINSHATVLTTNVANFDFAGIAAWHIDPDRRATGHRTTTLDYFEPNLATIDQLLNRAPNAAIKLAPATKAPENWIDCCELEWISRDGECKQQVAWHGALASNAAHHRATVISSACELVPRSIIGPPNTPVPITHQPNQYLFDLDPAITAARLTGNLAAEHNLSALAAGPTYLTGDRPLADPALACFEVTDVLPFRVNKLAQHLRARNIGQLEVKKRNVDLDPEKLRRDLKLQGTNAATLLITPISGRPTAIIAHRVARPPTP